MLERLTDSRARLLGTNGGVHAPDDNRFRDARGLYARTIVVEKDVGTRGKDDVSK